MRNMKLFTNVAVVAALVVAGVAIAAGPVTLDYNAGGGSRAKIRGTTKSVDVDTSTGVIDTADRDLVRALNCNPGETIVCDPTAFNPNTRVDEKSTCKCVAPPQPPVTGVDTRQAG